MFLGRREGRMVLDMGYIASGFAELSRILEACAEPAVLFGATGEITMHNPPAASLDGGVLTARARHVLSRALAGEEVFESEIVLEVPGYVGAIELAATLHPVRSSLGTVVGALGIVRPSASRARAALARAADVFLAAAAFDPTTSVLLFDADKQVVLSSEALPAELPAECDRALRGEVSRARTSCGGLPMARAAHRDAHVDGREVRSGPIRDSLGFIVGGLLVAYNVAPPQTRV